MTRKKSIQFKAAFLIILFSLNTIIGFACAIGINMGFNSNHHHADEAIETNMHLHAGGEKHIHHNKAQNNHNEADNDHHKSKDSKDNCCNDKVLQFTQVDKSVPQSFSVINPIFFTSFVSTFYNSEILFLSQGTLNIKYFVRSHHPPISDIRIVIQSFQI
jgi:hypothetical protein